MTFTLSPTDDPELSVVMVTRGGWPVTERAITALAEHTSRPLELLVVDNASPDETREQLSKAGNVSVTLNDTNRGFGPAVNQAAAQARGEYLVLLNPDAFVHPGWDEPLVEALARPSVGAAVPKYLHPDGTLQEAGVLLARDGTVRLYGDGDDPNRPWFRFRRAVDYGSAVCMVIRTATFAGLNGFDESYAPAYYEDTDLCMRLAEDGLEVVYEPRSTVTHVRYGSSAAEAANELSEVNRKLFAERWSFRLSGRPGTFAGSSVQSEIAARDAMATPRVLMCGHADRSGAEQLARALLDGWPRARLTWAVPPGQRGGFDPGSWREHGVEVIDNEQLEWLEARLFHYDVVIAGDRLTAEARTAIERTQPQATWLALERVVSQPDSQHAVLRAALAGAGIAPTPELSPRR